MAARCERCDWTGPERDDWAEEFCDLAEHNRESGHGPIPRQGRADNGPVQAHFDAGQLALIHMACRHERNALRGLLRGARHRRKRGQLNELSLSVERLTTIIDACEAVVPRLAAMRNLDIP